MKKIYILLVFCAFAKTATAQSHVDLVKINYGNIINAGYDGSDAETNVLAFDMSVTYPIKLSEKAAIITGVDYSNQSLELFPESAEVDLSFITLKVGMSLQHSRKWSGTYLVLPKIASQNLTNRNSFFIGGLALLKYQKSASLQYRFGMYGSSEAFGTIITPILGLYYQSADERWGSTINFPINGDVNYNFNGGIRAGFSFQAPIRTYRLAVSDNLMPKSRSLHVQSDSIELGPYIEHGFLENNLLLRFQAGYSSIDYQVYVDSDKLPLRIAAFEIDDNRNRLNPEMNGNIFLKIGAVYRFHFDKENEEPKE